MSDRELDMLLALSIAAMLTLAAGLIWFGLPGIGDGLESML